MELKDTETLIRKLFSLMCVEVSAVEYVTVGGHGVYSVRSEDSKLLIGPQGETLRALNHVVRRMLEQQGDDAARCMVDVNGYQLNRIQDIEQKARLLADRVRTFRASAEMLPMNAYERMIIHSMFSEDRDIDTESVGFGKDRHVVLKPKEAPNVVGENHTTPS
ncbi:MAG: hypothetical protein KBD21_03320 [Candidatus Pacebacteria bacterium]|nr:hypothetical protein [Candidatus Paceibacterota bacterium]